jgi:CheY-like chemotaxis protein
MENRILLVDDSKPMLTLLNGLFKAHYNVVCKPSAISALESLQDGSLPDLIITDINMPEMDGYEFVKQLKARNSYKNIPVMVLSSNQVSSDRLKLYKMGIDEYLVKPFNPEELYLRAEKLIASLGKQAEA